MVVELTPLGRVRLGVIRLFDELRRRRRKKKKIGKRELERKEDEFSVSFEFEIVIRGRGEGRRRIVFSRVGQKPEVDAKRGGLA